MKFWNRCTASTMNTTSGRRPSSAFCSKAAFNSVDRKRLYKEAKSFLKVRAMRHKWVKDKRQEATTTAAARQGLRRWRDLSQVSGAGRSHPFRRCRRLPALARDEAGGQRFAADLPSVVFAILNPWVAFGIFFLLGFFACYMTALSWADLTYVLPATSLGYVLLALIAKFFLHEQMSATRWLGIVLISAGVGFVTQGPALTPSA